MEFFTEKGRKNCVKERILRKYPRNADVAKLVDAQASGACELRFVRVQVSPSAPICALAGPDRSALGVFMSVSILKWKKSEEQPFLRLSKGGRQEHRASFLRMDFFAVSPYNYQEMIPLFLNL